MKKIISIVIWKIIYNFFKLFPVNEKKIVFESFLGRNYSGNPKAIFEYVQEKKSNEYDCIWFFKNDKKIKGAKSIIRIKSLSYYYHLATAKYIVTNSRMPLGFKRKNKQIYIQTWHGTPLKKLVYDMENVTLPGIDKENYFKNFTEDVNEWSYLISPNEHSTKSFRSAFRFEKEILEIGYPRNDYLVNYPKEDIRKIKNKLKIKENKKVLLYAPTFRDNDFSTRGNYNQPININFKKIQEENSDWVILLRTHYLVTQNINIKEYENVIDVGNYDEINELYVISDALMTDYSSVFFDYAILKRPMIFFAYDLEEYENELRGFYLDYLNTIPGSNIKDTKELSAILKNFEKYSQENQEKLIKFNEKFNEFEKGKASQE